jgi:HAD superfamily hydrolase (TIGR01509 family)
MKGILWDNDGVLVNTEGLFYEANRALFAEHDIVLTPEQFFDWFLCDNLGAWHLLEARNYPPEEIVRLRADRNHRYAQHLQNSSNLAIAGMQEVLSTLAENTRMGIVTSSRHDHFHMIHRPLNLLGHFEFVVTEEDYHNSKPAPDPYLLGLKKLGLAPQDCLVVEDSPRGLRAALAAGLRCIVIRNELSHHYPFTGALCVVDTPGALLEALQTHR